MALVICFPWGTSLYLLISGPKKLNMRKIILAVAVSLDGYIEGPNGEYDRDCGTNQRDIDANGDHNPDAFQR